jgi:hypothetical protein
MYLSWGEGPHAMEIAYSVWSAQAWSNGGELPPIIVYTDDPDRFGQLPLEVVPVDKGQIQKWIGDEGYPFRVKICCLADALQRFGCPIVYLDSDTYFLGDPWTLIGRVRPGHSMMHTWECHLDDSGDPQYSGAPARLRERGITDKAGHRLEISGLFDSYNSGVVGIHPDDAPILEDALCLTDQIYRTTGVRTSEQLALGYLLPRRTRMSSAWDLVYHYHTWALRMRFRDELPSLLADSADMSTAERVEWLYERRPRCPLRRRLHVRVQHALRRLGLNKQKVVFTSESW